MRLRPWVIITVLAVIATINAHKAGHAYFHLWLGAVGQSVWVVLVVGVVVMLVKARKR